MQIIEWIKRSRSDIKPSHFYLYRADSDGEPGSVLETARSFSLQSRRMQRSADTQRSTQSVKKSDTNCARPSRELHELDASLVNDPGLISRSPEVSQCRHLKYPHPPIERKQIWNSMEKVLNWALTSTLCLQDRIGQDGESNPSTYIPFQRIGNRMTGHG